MHLRFYGLLLLLLTCWACQGDSTHKYQARSLLTYDFPIDVLTPDSVHIETEDWMVQKTVSLVNEAEDYYLLISMASAKSTDASTVKQSTKRAVETESDFEKILSEDEHGFVYSTLLDSTTQRHDFRYVRIIGDKAYIYQMDIQPRIYSLEQVQHMYELVKEGA